jgi:hypothetical protein
MRLTLAMLVVLVFAYVVCAGQAPHVTVAEISPTVIGGSINEYTSAPPDILPTPQGEGSRTGRLWIRNTGKGLLIAGDVEGGAPDFPRDNRRLFRHMLHVAPISLPFSVDCAYFPSPRGCHSVGIAPACLRRLCALCVSAVNPIFSVVCHLLFTLSFEGQSLGALFATSIVCFQ